MTHQKKNVTSFFIPGGKLDTSVFIADDVFIFNFTCNAHKTRYHLTAIYLNVIYVEPKKKEAKLELADCRFHLY